MSERQTAAVTTDNSAIIASQMAGAAPEFTADGEEIISTRFGKIAIRRDKPMRFARGLLGMPEKMNFCLLDFPVKKFPQFRLLQSLDDDALSFITLPLELENSIIDREDIDKACKDLNIAAHDLAILLIVSIHRGPAEVKISVNARAPVMIDVAKREATQYVFQNNRYLVQQTLTMVEQGS